MRQLQYGTTVIDYVLDYAERRTLGVRVSPDGRVSVTAPPGTDLATIERKLLSRAAWIRRQRDYFLSFQPRTSERRYVSGETHLYLGKRYRLKVHRVDEEGEEGVRLERGYLHLRTCAPPPPRTATVPTCCCNVSTKLTPVGIFPACWPHAYPPPGPFTPDR